MVSDPCAALLDRVGGDAQIVAELCDAFLEDAPRRLELVRAALASGDAQAVRHEAHALKGVAAAFDATDLVSAARHLERLASDGTLEDASLSWRALERHGRMLIEAVHACRERLACRS